MSLLTWQKEYVSGEEEGSAVWSYIVIHPKLYTRFSGKISFWGLWDMVRWDRWDARRPMFPTIPPSPPHPTSMGLFLTY